MNLPNLAMAIQNVKFLVLDLLIQQFCGVDSAALFRVSIANTIGIPIYICGCKSVPYEHAQEIIEGVLVATMLLSNYRLSVPVHLLELRLDPSRYNRISATQGCV